MANFHTIITAEETLPCSAAEAAQIADLLQNDADDLNEDACGFSFEYDGACGYLFAEEQGNPGALPDAVLDALAALVRRAGRPYLECGMAYTGTPAEAVAAALEAAEIRLGHSVSWVTEAPEASEPRVVEHGDGTLAVRLLRVPPS